VIGDAVNVASRVEGLTKVLAVDALVSEATWARLPPPLRGRRVAAKRVKGRTEYVVVYSLDPEALAGEPSGPVTIALA
jgi:class 3 adenylate cyclase